MSGAGPAAAGLASPFSVGPVTGLPAPPVAVAQGESTDAGEATLWVLGGHAVWEVTIAASGTGTVTSTTPLAPGADPVAIACIRPVDGDPGLWRGCGDPAHAGQTTASVFVLDRASEAVLVFERNEDGSLAQKASLAVGSRPSAFAFADLDAHTVGPGVGPGGADVPALVDVAVANEGSDDVSVLLAREDGSYAPQRRIAVGARPRDLVAGYFDGWGGIDLAVADSGAKSVSILRGDGRGAFARADVAVAAPPTSLLAGPPGRLISTATHGTNCSSLTPTAPSACCAGAGAACRGSRRACRCPQEPRVSRSLCG
jgi:hypothetical protein